MFCPRCGSSPGDDLKFCKACGANLQAVRQAIDSREAGEKLDWSKTWVAEMLMSGEEAERRKQELERRRGITPAVRRYQEIKAGVITSCAGFGISALLLILMQGIILSGEATPGAAEILSRLWIVGILPMMVGLALIINGVFVSKRLVELAERAERLGTKSLPEQSEPHLLRSPDTTEFVPSSFSVTEGTTKHLKTSQ